jgi:hypothetical protein
MVLFLWLVVGGRRPWRECADVRTRYILHAFFLYQGYDISVSGEAHCTPAVGRPAVGKKHSLACGLWAGGTEYGVNFVLLNKIVCFVLCVTLFPFVIFSADLKVFSYRRTDRRIINLGGAG